VPAPSKPPPSTSPSRTSKAGPSEPPPSQQMPGHAPGGGGLYLAGAVVLAGGAVALIAWKSCNAPPPPVVQQSVSATVTAPVHTDEPVHVFAPPALPKVDEEPDAGKPVPKATGGTGGPTVAAGPGPCGPSCTGPGSPALSSALRGRAQSAQGCYNRALRTSEVSGSMTVRVQVGPSGQVCSASLSADSVHSDAVASCVLGRFRGQTFPPPSGGCATVDIPISFTIKQ
jgi:TonB family protein